MGISSVFRLLCVNEGIYIAQQIAYACIILHYKRALHVSYSNIVMIIIILCAVCTVLSSLWGEMWKKATAIDEHTSQNHWLGA